VAGAVFNDPWGAVADRYRITSTIRNNVAGTPAGGVVRIATHGINVPAVLKALVRAHRCKVGVRVLVPGKTWKDNPVVTLRRELGTDVSRNSWIARCHGSCTTEGSDGIMHVKLHLFSKVRSPEGPTEHVTVYSSANLTRRQATNRYNDAYQVVDDAAVYDSARSYFDTLAQGTEGEIVPFTTAPGFRQYYFPSDDDFHREVFERTRCRTDEGRTTVEFAVSIWARVDVAEQLAELDRAGCAVRLLVALGKADQDVLRLLHRREVPTRVQSVAQGDQAVHSKYVAIRGRHRGRTVSTVYAGSLNVSRFSARTANNVMLRIVDDEDDYAAYHRHFSLLWKQSRPLRASDVRSADRLDAAEAEGQS
jgi:PLD-like domain